MKHHPLIPLLFLVALALPAAVQAQVGKQVEVTKTYVPELDQALKLAIEPDMVDTVTMQPDIDYTITPLSLKHNMATRPIRPATVTYWEFNRPLPFYLKVGAGYPFNTALDLYLSTQHASTGYAMLFVNHEGQYARIRNDYAEKNNSTRMYNRIGAAAGKYLGRHVLEGEVSYTDRGFHADGSPRRPEEIAEITGPTAFWGGDALRAGVAEARVRIGDDFQDLSRFNFNVAAHGALFREHACGRAGESTLGAELALGQRFNGHLLRFDAGVEQIAGTRSSRYNDLTASGGLQYGFRSARFDLLLGAALRYDRVQPDDPDAGADSKVWLLPSLRLRFDGGRSRAIPFVELDSEWENNSYASLFLRNPVALYGAGLDRNSVGYHLRAGLEGNVARGRMAYRLYAGALTERNHIYWLICRGRNYGMAAIAGYGRLTGASLNFETDIKPADGLQLAFALHGNLYNKPDAEQGAPRCNGLPAFRAEAGLHYRSRKIAFGITADMQSRRRWSCFDMDELIPEEITDGEIGYETALWEVPFTVDLRASFDWFVGERATLFAEGRNLAAARLCQWPGLPELGPNFTLGVKVQF